MSAGFGADLKVETDLSVLVGEMAEIPCSSPTHSEGAPWHDEGEAKWYLMLTHDCTWQKAGYVYPVCNRLGQMILGNADSGVAKVRCLNCLHVTRGGQDALVKVVGKVGGGSSG